MPCYFEYDSVYSIVQARFEGHVTGEELVRFYLRAVEMISLIDPVAGVVDLSGVTSFDVSLETVQRLAKLRPVMLDPRRPRVIIAPSELIFQLARAFELAGQPTRPNLHVVRTHREAWTLLGVREPQFTSRV